MDDSERLVKRYLTDIDRGSVVFEPDGNIPPDFSLAGTIGVEVRRLNQNLEHPDGSIEGLEKLAIPLWQRLERLLPSIAPSSGGESWFVGIDFGRPVGTWKPLWAQIQRELLAFKARPERKQDRIRVAGNFYLDLIRSSKDEGSFFLLGISSDDDSGGWVMAEIEKNLRLCIAEKERKIAPHRNKYSEWWLVLTDHIDYSMEPEDREAFRVEIMPRVQHSFSKIVLIDPRDYRRAFEV